MPKAKPRIYKQRFTSQEFGEHIGDSKIFRHWKFSDNLSMDELGDKLLQRKPEFINATYEQLIADNPILGRIDLTKGFIEPNNKGLKCNSLTKEEFTLYSKFDVCFGALSKFCYRDIKWFVEHQNIVTYNRKNRDRSDAIASHFDMFPQFVMSPFTMRRIEKLMKN